MHYPYIQSKKQIEKGVCIVCSKGKQVIQIEWRVDWFQGNCEFEEVCQSCFDKRQSKEKKKEQAYIKKMEPIWEKQLKKQTEREQTVKNIVSELGFELKQYPNGQWAIGNILDWWTTSGTAIERKSKKRYNFSFREPQKIKEVLSTLASK